MCIKRLVSLRKLRYHLHVNTKRTVTNCALYRTWELMDGVNNYTVMWEEDITLYTEDITIVEHYTEQYFNTCRYITFYIQPRTICCNCINVAYIDITWYNVKILCEKDNES